MIAPTAPTGVPHNILTLDENEPAAVFFRQALNLPAGTRLTVLVDAPHEPLTLLFEIFGHFNPSRPQKRYLFCNDPNEPDRVTAISEAKARELVGLLSHPEIGVTPLPAATAIEAYRRLEIAEPSFEAIRRGAPRAYEPPKPG